MSKAHEMTVSNLRVQCPRQILVAGRPAHFGDLVLWLSAETAKHTGSVAVAAYEYKMCLIIPLQQTAVVVGLGRLW